MSSQENDSFLEEELDEVYNLENEDEEALLAEDDGQRLTHDDEIWQEESYENEGESTVQEEDCLDLEAAETLEEEDVLEKHRINNNLSPIKTDNVGKQQILKTEITEDEFLQMGGSKEEEDNKKEDSDEEEEEEDDEEDTEGRGRFRLERTNNTVSSKVVGVRQSIPDTLDGVQVTDEPALNVGRRNNRRGVGPRMRARGRGMYNGRRPDHHMFGRQFQPHQQYLQPLVRPGLFQHPQQQPLGVPETIPSFISQPIETNSPVNNLLTNTPPAQNSPQKILINPHFRGPLPGRPQFWVPQETQEFHEVSYPPENCMHPNSQMVPPHFMQPPPQVQSMNLPNSYTDVQYNQPQGAYQQQHTPIEMPPSWGSREDNYATPQYQQLGRHNMQQLPPQSQPHYSGLELSPIMPPPAFNQPPPVRMQQQAHSWPQSQTSHQDYQYGNSFHSSQPPPPGVYPDIQPPPRFPPPLRPQHPQQVTTFQPQMDYSVPPPSFQGDSNNYHIIPQGSPGNIVPVQHQPPPALMQQRPLPSQSLMPHQASVRPLMSQHVQQQGKNRLGVQRINSQVQQQRVPVHQRLQKNFANAKPAQKRQNTVNLLVSSPLKQQKLLPIAVTEDIPSAESSPVMPEKATAEVANSTGMTVQELHAYNMKIREQKLMREEVLRRKEERRRQLIEEKQQVEKDDTATGCPEEKGELQGSAIATIVNRSTVEPCTNAMPSPNTGQNFTADLLIPAQTSPVVRGRGSMQGRVLKRLVLSAHQSNAGVGRGNISSPGGKGKIGSEQRGRGVQGTRWLGRGAVRGLARGAARGAAPNIIKTKGMRGPHQASIPAGARRGAMKGVKGGGAGNNLVTLGMQTQTASQRGGMALKNVGNAQKTGKPVTNNYVLKTLVCGEKILPRGGQASRGRGRGRTVVMNASEIPKLNTNSVNAVQPQQPPTRRVVQSAPAQATAVAPTKVQNTVKPTSSTIIIENLSTATSKQTLLKMSETFKLQKIMMNQGIATLTFANVEGAAKFYQKYNRKMVDLSLVTVKYA